MPKDSLFKKSDPKKSLSLFSQKHKTPAFSPKASLKTKRGVSSFHPDRPKLKKEAPKKDEKLKKEELQKPEDKKNVKLCDGKVFDFRTLKSQSVYDQKKAAKAKKKHEDDLANTGFKYGEYAKEELKERVFSKENGGLKMARDPKIYFGCMFFIKQAQKQKEREWANIDLQRSVKLAKA
jgi:hypothetical protein